MNIKFLSVIKNFSYTFSANIISLVISFLTIALIPEHIGVAEFGYWQLYNFYISYVIFFRFGHADGIYLKFGGLEYGKINKQSFASQFWIIVVFEIILSLAFILIGLRFIDSFDRLYIVIIVSMGIAIIIPKTLLQVVMQATNRISNYAMSIIIERVLYGIFLVLFLLLGFKDYKILVLIDIGTKLISLIYTMYSCRDIVFAKLINIKDALLEVLLNMKIGMNLMLSSIISMLIIGVIRFGIERKWDIETFGTVSLTISISNLLMLFISAIGIVFYPILKKISLEKLPMIYINIKNILVFSLFGLLILYFPMLEILRIWLPSYSEGLRFMALLFPICVFESKMSMLIIPYYNSLRREKLMLRINMITFVLSIISTIFFVFIIGNLELSVLLITILLTLRAQVAEILLFKILNIKSYITVIYEIILTIAFIVIAWFFPSKYGILLYAFIFIVYAYLNKISILNSWRFIYNYGFHKNEHINS